MTDELDLKAFEEFQKRAFRTATAIYFVALAVAIVIERQFGPLLGGILLGGAAAMAADRYRIWAMRRLARQATAQEAFRYPLISAGRYIFLAVGLVAAVMLARRFDQNMYIFAAAGAMFIPSLAIIIEAARDSKRGKGSK